MKIQYIAIEREYGSGGTEIAKKLAEKCRISYYGEEILKQAAKELHISVKEAEQYEEKITNSILYSAYVLNQAQTGNTDFMPMESKVYIAEHRAIKKFAQMGRAVFVGHCAAESLKEKKVLRIFIHASEEFKYERIVSDYKIPKDSAKTVCKRYNKKRANYYAYNTQKKWEDMSNYDMVLDSSTIGIDGCVNAIAALL